MGSGYIYQNIHPMSAPKSYIVRYDEKKKLFRLIPEKGRAMRIKGDHKKFEWLQQLAPGKIVKISATGRWTASKDYDGLFQKIEQAAVTKQTSKHKQGKPPVKKLPKDSSKTSAQSPKADHTSASTESAGNKVSVLGHHPVELEVEAKMSRYVPCNQVSEQEYDELLLEVADFYTSVSFASVSTVQRKFKIGYNRACRIVDSLEALAVIADGKAIVDNTDELAAFLGNAPASIDLNVDPKSPDWPITEKINCMACQGAGKTISISIEKTGFLKLRKKEVHTDLICEACKGLGYTEKQHFPYRFEAPNYHRFSLQVDFDFDTVAKELIDHFIGGDEFSKEDLFSFLKNNSPIQSIAEAAFCAQYSFRDGSPPTATDVPAKATWTTIKSLSDQLNSYSFFLLCDTEAFISSLFKTQILDNGSKRRSTKDRSIYYKFTRAAKKLYQNL